MKVGRIYSVEAGVVASVIRIDEIGIEERERDREKEKVATRSYRERIKRSNESE